MHMKANESRAISRLGKICYTQNRILCREDLFLDESTNMKNAFKSSAFFGNHNNAKSRVFTPEVKHEEEPDSGQNAKELDAVDLIIKEEEENRRNSLLRSPQYETKAQHLRKIFLSKEGEKAPKEQQPMTKITQRKWEHITKQKNALEPYWNNNYDGLKGNEFDSKAKKALRQKPEDLTVKKRTPKLKRTLWIPRAQSVTSVELIDSLPVPQPQVSQKVVKFDKAPRTITFGSSWTNENRFAFNPRDERKSKSRKPSGLRFKTQVPRDDKYFTVKLTPSTIMLNTEKYQTPLNKVGIPFEKMISRTEQNNFQKDHLMLGTRSKKSTKVFSPNFNSHKIQNLRGKRNLNKVSQLQISSPLFKTEIPRNSSTEENLEPHIIQVLTSTNTPRKRSQRNSKQKHLILQFRPNKLYELQNDTHSWSLVEQENFKSPCNIKYY